LIKRRKFFAAAATAGVGAASALAAPALAQAPQTVRWRLASSFPKSLDTIYGGGELLCERVSKLTDGKFLIRSFAAGEIVPAFSVVDAVQQATIEMCHTGSYYFVGKDLSFAFGTAMPFGLNARQQNAWIYHGGGQALLDQFYADYNMISFLGGNTGAQMGGWFRNEINTVADMRGLKMRIPGVGGQVWARLGAVPQAIAGGDIYPALERGTIDAAEWVGPYDDEKLGFYRIAKHYYYPGWWEPCAGLHFFINKDKWNALPGLFKEALTSAAREANGDVLAHYDTVNDQALQRLLAPETGVQLHKFSDEIMEAAQREAFAMYAEESARNPKFKRIFDPWNEFRRSQQHWFSLAEFGFDSFAIAHQQQQH
jgi:TRAP-type mannitol/chloroaromatic compound transport system substrate-binding protein